MKILITGGSSDIARAIAKRRVHLGDEVIITSSSESSLKQTLRSYQEAGMKIDGFVFDFARPEKSSTALQAVLKKGLDAVIFNAFTRVDKLRRLDEHSFSDISRYIQENVCGNIWLAQQILPTLCRASFGRLVLISSISAAIGTPNYPAYCAAKGALESLFLNIAVDYAEEGILSNILRLGLFKTTRTERFWAKPAYEARAAEYILQGKLGDPAQAAEALDPLLSATSYINCSVITVGGGLSFARAGRRRSKK